MTEIQLGKKLIRKTASSVQSRPLVVVLHPGYLDLRRAGTRTNFSVTYDAIYRYGAQLAANKLRAERLEKKKALRAARKAR